MASPLYPMPTPSWLLPKVNSNPLAAFLGDPRQFLRDNSSALIGLGAGIAGGGPDFGQAVSAGLSGAGQGAQIDTQRNQTQAQENQTRAYLEANRPDLLAKGLPLKDAYALAIKDLGTGVAANDPSATVGGRAQLAQTWGLTGDDAKTYVLTGKLPGGNQTARAGLGQPVFVRNRKDPTDIRGLQPMTTGPAVDLLTGQPLPNSADYIVDPVGISADKAGASKDAVNAANARATLPSAQNSYDQTLAVLEKFDPNSPNYDQSVVAGEGEQFGNVLGIPQQWLPVIPKTARANFLNIVDQLSGQAFLNIRQALKGAGQVTDYEGGKGEIALSRMRAAAERGDRPAFDQALIDYKTAIDNGMRLLRQQAQGGFSQGQPAVDNAGPQTLTYNPATGELE